MPVTTKPLTAAERRWIKEVNALLKKCPSDRLQGFTIGDHDVVVFDGSRMPEIDEYMQKSGYKRDFCTACEDLDLLLGKFGFPFPVHSTAG
jgi:hypothetical protein